MSKEAMKLALEALALRFSEGWHEGIKIDASDIMLLNDAAQALAEQPALKDECAMPEVCPEHAHAFFAKQPVQPQQEPWRPDVCPITGLPFFMWIEHHETGQMVPTYGGPYDSYTIPVREKDGSYCRERYDHDNGWWVTDEVEDVGVQIVSDQAYVSEDEPPAQRKPLPEDQLLGIWNKAITQDNGRGSHLSNQPFVHIARAIEAAHGIKENT